MNFNYDGAMIDLVNLLVGGADQKSAGRRQHLGNRFDRKFVASATMVANVYHARGIVRIGTDDFQGLRKRGASEEVYFLCLASLSTNPKKLKQNITYRISWVK